MAWINCFGTTPTWNTKNATHCREVYPISRGRYPITKSRWWNRAKICMQKFSKKASKKTEGCCESSNWVWVWEVLVFIVKHVFFTLNSSWENWFFPIIVYLKSYSILILENVLYHFGNRILFAKKWDILHYYQLKMKLNFDKNSSSFFSSTPSTVASLFPLASFSNQALNVENVTIFKVPTFCILSLVFCQNVPEGDTTWVQFVTGRLFCFVLV